MVPVQLDSRQCFVKASKFFLIFVMYICKSMGDGAQLFWGQNGWTECSLSCGGGTQRRLDNTSETRLCNVLNCPEDAGCLSAYLSFDQDYAGTIYDNSHNGNLAKLNNGSTIAKDGKFGKALKLVEGGNITFDVKTFHNRPRDAITVALWLKLSDVGGFHEIFFTCGKPQIYNMGEYHLELIKGHIRWSLKDINMKKVFNITSKQRIKSNTWTHIAASYHLKKNTPFIYINGQTAQNDKQSFIQHRDSIPNLEKVKMDWGCARLGDAGAKKPLEGMIDEFYIFKCALFLNEIQDLFMKNSYKRVSIPRPGRLENGIRNKVTGAQLQKQKTN